MTKVITFSRTFPAYHPKKGQPTYFVEKVWKSIYDQTGTLQGIGPYEGGYTEAFGIELKEEENIHFHKPKHHTIRAGSRWKKGDYFSPAVWGNNINPKSGKSGPYQSKQIKIAPDIEVKKVWDFNIKDSRFFVGKTAFGNYACKDFKRLALNDGLEVSDLLDWFQFPKDFNGQIICWNENINY